MNEKLAVLWADVMESLHNLMNYFKEQLVTDCPYKDNCQKQCEDKATRVPIKTVEQDDDLLDPFVNPKPGTLIEAVVEDFIEKMSPVKKAIFKAQEHSRKSNERDKEKRREKRVMKSREIFSIMPENLKKSYDLLANQSGLVGSIYFTQEEWNGSEKKTTGITFTKMKAELDDLGLIETSFEKGVGTRFEIHPKKDARCVVYSLTEKEANRIKQIYSDHGDVFSSWAPYENYSNTPHNLAEKSFYLEKGILRSHRYRVQEYYRITFAGKVMAGIYPEK